VVERAVAALDALFDRAYGSRWNPAHQSGGLAVALMLVAIATGCVLLFAYRIGAPYESMVAIQSQAWAGRWLRALHRYASDLAVLAVAFHALRMLAEGRTWGPRVLAWVTGVLLTGTMLVVGWTGYVLVWDDHGRLLGAAGARLFDSLHLLATPIGRTFGGGTPAPASFFFLNLFMHMALPLAMTLLLWVHTLRLARSRWLPERRLGWAVTLALTALALAWPAPLGPAADGLSLGDRAVYDAFYTAWIPLATRLSPLLAWGAVAVLVLLPLSVPAWWRPARARQAPPSLHNPLACNGCRQCVVDCPFEAISMVPNTTGRGTHTEIAFVNTSRCVSCGLCSGSCDQLAIGPPGREGHAQVALARAVAPEVDAETVVLIHCAHAGVGEALMLQTFARGPRLVAWGVDCVGSLHMLPVQQLAERCRGVFVLGCPPGRCHSREGAGLALDRLLHGREPQLKRPLDPTRVCFAHGGPSDLDALERDLRWFAANAGERVASASDGARRRGPFAWAGAFMLTAALLLATASLSQIRAGGEPPQGAVRLAWRLPGQSWLDCRPLSKEEIERLPAHMRRTQDCRTVHLHYRLRAWVDGALRVDREVAPLGARGDRPLYVDEDVAVAPGARSVKVEFEPLEDPRHVGLELELETALEVGVGRARLVTFDADRRQLVAR
jgi:ferredoxin